MEYIDLIGPGLQLVALTISSPSLFKLSSLQPKVQAHLARVYLTLALSLVVCVLGVAAEVVLQLGWNWTATGLVCCSILLALTPSTPATLIERYALLGGAAFFSGAVVGPEVAVAAVHFPAVLVSALLGTVVVFACFSAAALITPRRFYLYLGGYLSSASLALLGMQLAASFFGGEAAVFSADLYLGLLLFMAYVVVDTQFIVDRAHAGDMDHVKHALELLLDFLSIFLHLLIILLEHAEKKKKEEENSKKSEKKQCKD